MSLKEKMAGLRKALQSSGDENVKAFSSAFIVIALIIIGVIAFFLDIIFVTMIWNALPGGFLRLFASGGAILVSPVVILLLLAKLYYFRRGGQLIFAFVAFVVDIAFAALNTYCAFQLAWNAPDSFVITWRNLSPITPCVIMLCLAILIMLDPNAARLNKERMYKERERDLEMQFEQEEREREFALKQLDAELVAAQKEAAIEIKTQALEEYKTQLKAEILGPEALAHLREAARRLREESLHTLTGLPRGAITALPAPSPEQWRQAGIPAQHYVAPGPITFEQHAAWLDTLSPEELQAVITQRVKDFQAVNPPRDPESGASLEQLYEKYGSGEGFAEFVARMTRAAQPSPLAQPHLTPTASQAGETNGNGH